MAVNNESVIESRNPTEYATEDKQQIKTKSDPLPMSQDDGFKDEYLSPPKAVEAIKASLPDQAVKTEAKYDVKTRPTTNKKYNLKDAMVEVKHEASLDRSTTRELFKE